MPKVNLKFLASFRELAGADSLVAEADTPEQALRVLGLYDAIMEKTPLVAINHEVTDMDMPLKDGDEVAFLPPMTGG